MYRCKQLKVAALGRMCTIVKQQASSFAYLEEVRQHLARLPSIDPSTRTLIMTGYPNVGKSSLMNKLTRANVDVQPYAFTTKSLFVGHMDYKYLKWQVLDTPGILDHPLEERNTIEMQAVTALAHLHATVMFLLDISETCNYTIKEQVGLFHSLRPLFANKPLLLVLTKIDLQKYEDLDEEDRKMIEDIRGLGVTVMELSSASEIGIAKVKEQACDMLLAVRTEAKLKIHQNDESILSRLHLAVPKKRDNIERPPVTVERKKKSADGDGMEDEDAMTFSLTPGSRDREQALLDEEKWKRGELPWSEYMKERERFLLANPEWKYDVIPEIMDGKNILDFVDPDIEEKLKALEEEENERLAQLEEELKAEGGADELNPEEAEKLSMINRRRVKAKLISSIHYNQKNKAFIKKAAPEAGEAFATHLESLGIDKEDARGVARRAADAQVGMAKVAAAKLAKRSRRGEDSDDSSDDTELPDDLQRVKRIRRELSAARERSLSRSQVRKLKREEEEIKNKPQPGSGFKDASVFLSFFLSSFSFINYSIYLSLFYFSFFVYLFILFIK